MKKRVGIILLALVMMFSVIGCKKEEKKEEKSDKKMEQKSDKKGETTAGKKKILVTSTMLTDLVKELVKDDAEVEGLLGTGVDPHEYEPSAGDVKRLKDADIIIYSGLHLEGKMADIFEQLKKDGKVVIEAAGSLPKDKLIDWEEEGQTEELKDPHVWNSIEMWDMVAKFVGEQLKANIDGKAGAIEANYQKYSGELKKLHEELKEQIKQIPEKSRYLITAHDAFQYLARDYGIQVKAIQGVSTETEANTKDIENLAKFIVEHDIKSIFVESSVSDKNMKALQEAVKSKGKEVKIGGELFSDSLGEKGTEAETYIGMMKTNIRTIVEGLK